MRIIIFYCHKLKFQVLWDDKLLWVLQFLGKSEITNGINNYIMEMKIKHQMNIYTSN